MNRLALLFVVCSLVGFGRAQCPADGPCGLVADGEGVCCADSVAWITEFLNSYNGSIYKIAIKCHEKAFLDLEQISLSVTSAGNRLPIELEIEDCATTFNGGYNTYKPSIHTLVGLRSLTIVNCSVNDIVLPTFGVELPSLQNFTWQNNYIYGNLYLKSLAATDDRIRNNDYFWRNPVFFPFEWVNANPCGSMFWSTYESPGMAEDRRCWCSASTNISNSIDVNCFGSEIDDVKAAVYAINATGQNVGQILMYNLQFPELDPNFVVPVARTTTTPVPETTTENLEIFNLPQDEVVTKTDSIRDVDRYNTRPFPMSLSVYNCHSIENLTNTTEQTYVQDRIRSVMTMFTNFERYVQKLNFADCPTLGVLAAMDGELGPSIVPPPTQRGITLRRGSASEIGLSRNLLTMEDISKHFPYPIANTHVKRLDMSGNNFTMFGSHFGFAFNPVNLTELDLSYCNIQDAEYSAFRAFQQVKMLNLSSNPMTFIRPEWFPRLKKLEVLDLSFCDIYGAYSVEVTYPPIWPESLLELNLTHTVLVDQDDPAYGGKLFVRFNANFFYGLNNLIRLDLERAVATYMARDSFAPLQSLQWLNLNTEALANDPYNKRFTPDFFEYLPTLRTLIIQCQNFINTTYYTAPCELFQPLRLLEELHIEKLQNANPSKCVYQATWCSQVHEFLTWMKYFGTRTVESKEHQKENKSVADLGEIICFRDEDYPDAFRTRRLSSYMTFLKNNNLTFDPLPDPSYNDTNNANTTTISPLFYPGQLVTQVGNLAGIIWEQYKMPLAVILTLCCVVLCIINPFSTMHICMKFTRKGRERWQRRSLQKASIKREPTNAKDEIKEEGPHHWHKKVKAEFYSSTLINGFNYVYTAWWRFEAVIWYMIILVMACLFVYEAAQLFVQYRYGDPMINSNLVSAPTFTQQPFTVCLPIKDRNLKRSPSDVRALMNSKTCNRHKNGTKIQLSREQMLKNGLLFDTIMIRLGLQMAWEGTALNNTPPEIPDWVHELDTILKERNETLGDWLNSTNGALCEAMNIHATSVERGNPYAIPNVAMNVQACKDILQQTGKVNLPETASCAPTCGITWYDPFGTHQMCIRFPGLYNFDGYHISVALNLAPMDYFYEPTPATVDVTGFANPVSAGRSLIPAPVLMHYDNSLDIQLKLTVEHLETFRVTGDEKRCYSDCVGFMRVEEIYKFCKCRPLLWPKQSSSYEQSSDDGTSFRDCTIEDYTHACACPDKNDKSIPTDSKNCSLTQEGYIDKCANQIPCKFWDYTIRSSSKGMTIDNSTIIRFEGTNTMYVDFFEYDGRTLHNFLSDIGGILGLWLGASLIAAIHVVIFFAKLIYIFIYTKYMIRTQKKADKSIKKQPTIIRVDG